MIEDHLRAHLSAASLGTVSLYCGPVRAADLPAIPYRALFICESGGPPASPYMDSANTAWRSMRVQVRIRGEPNSYQSTRDLAQAVWSNIQESTVTGGYTRVVFEQS
mgnify:CR=1 FL=1